VKDTFCRACGAKLTRSFVDLGMQPPSNSFVPTDRADEPEVSYTLHAFVCDSCYLVQLAECVPPTTIFSDQYAYFSSFSQSWLEHAKRYTEEMLVRFSLDAEAHVAEVASNDGYLLRWFVERGLRVTGIEPAANCAEAAKTVGVHSEVCFFGKETARAIAAKRGCADLMAANNVLAHVPNIRDFAAGFREMLAPEGVATFEFPQLLSLIDHNEFDTIYHEHFSYLALGPVKKVMESQGLRVFDVTDLPTHGGSLRVFVCHADASHPEHPAVAAQIEKERVFGLTDPAFFDAYAERVVGVKDSLLEFLIKARRNGKTVCGYGAPAKGNTLLNYCGIGPEYVSFTVDLNPAKQNTLLPGSRIPVYPVEEIAGRKPDYVIILPWNLKDEIVRQMDGIRAWGGRFVTAIPDLKVF